MPEHSHIRPMRRLRLRRSGASARQSAGLLSAARRHGVAMATLCLATTAAAEPIQSVSVIQETAESYLTAALESMHEGTISVSAARPDQRLRLHACDEPLEGFLPHGRDPLRATTVGVRCTGAAPWTIYVPVSVEIHSQVVVAARPLHRGSRILSDDLRISARDISRHRDAWFTQPDDVAGLEARRSIREGDIITARSVEEPLLIRRGSEVVIEAGRGNGIQITGRGEALQNGREGDRIRVRNLDSGREIEGRVTAPNRVEVAF